MCWCKLRIARKQLPNTAAECSRSRNKNESLVGRDLTYLGSRASRVRGRRRERKGLSEEWW